MVVTTERPPAKRQELGARIHGAVEGIDPAMGLSSSASAPDISEAQFWQVPDHLRRNLELKKSQGFISSGSKNGVSAQRLPYATEATREEAAVTAHSPQLVLEADPMDIVDQYRGEVEAIASEDLSGVTPTSSLLQRMHIVTRMEEIDRFMKVEEPFDGTDLKAEIQRKIQEEMEREGTYEISGLSIANPTHPEENQDRFLFNKQKGYTIVCDGVSEGKGGGIAAEEVIKAVDRAFDSPALFDWSVDTSDTAKDVRSAPTKRDRLKAFSTHALESAVGLMEKSADRKLRETGAGGWESMATCFVALQVIEEEDSYHLAGPYAGDTSAHVIKRDGRMISLTQAEGVALQAAKEGYITQEEAAKINAILERAEKPDDLNEINTIEGLDNINWADQLPSLVENGYDLDSFSRAEKIWYSRNVVSNYIGIGPVNLSFIDYEIEEDDVAVVVGSDGVFDPESLQNVERVMALDIPWDQKAKKLVHMASHDGNLPSGTYFRTKGGDDATVTLMVLPDFVWKKKQRPEVSEVDTFAEEVKGWPKEKTSAEIEWLLSGPTDENKRKVAILEHALKERYTLSDEEYRAVVRRGEEYMDALSYEKLQEEIDRATTFLHSSPVGNPFVEGWLEYLMQYQQDRNKTREVQEEGVSVRYSGPIAIINRNEPRVESLEVNAFAEEIKHWPIEKIYNQYQVFSADGFRKHRGKLNALGNEELRRKNLESEANAFAEERNATHPQVIEEHISTSTKIVENIPGKKRRPSSRMARLGIVAGILTLGSAGVAAFGLANHIQSSGEGNGVKITLAPGAHPETVQGPALPSAKKVKPISSLSDPMKAVYAPNIDLRVIAGSATEFVSAKTVNNPPMRTPDMRIDPTIGPNESFKSSSVNKLPAYPDNDISNLPHTDPASRIVGSVTPNEEKAETVTEYVIQPGDTMLGILQAHGYTIDELKNPEVHKKLIAANPQLVRQSYAMAWTIVNFPKPSYTSMMITAAQKAVNNMNQAGLDLQTGTFSNVKRFDSISQTDVEDLFHYIPIGGKTNIPLK